MQGRRRESGRFLIVLVLLVGLSSGVIYVREILGAPERLYQEGLEAYGNRAYAGAANAWEQAVELGHMGAHMRLGALHLEGEGVARNHKQAFAIFERAANEDWPPAQLQLARLYEHGRGVSPDLEQAVLWYWAAARNADPEAQLELGRIHEQGRGVDVDPVEAVRWYLRAAQAGLGDAQLALGIAYQEGLGVEQSLADAMHWLTRAAEDAEIGEAAYRVGRFHEFGEGVHKDLGQAAWYYEKGTEDHHTESFYRLGQLTELGKGVVKDLDAAVRLYSYAAAEGHPEAQYRLARAFELGEGAHRSRSKAKKLYGDAAENGHSDAIGALAAMGLDRAELSGYKRRQREAKRSEEREKQQSVQSLKMGRPGMCEIGSSGGRVVEMRTRVDCLNRGGAFKESSGSTLGGFTTVDTEQDWNRQRRDLRRRHNEQLRSEYRRDNYNSQASEPPSGDYIVCNDRGSRDRSGRAHYRCSSAIPKTSATTSNWCREQGYDRSRSFKNKRSARSWRSRNCS